MDMAELNSRCCLWRDAVPLAGCAADVALMEARLQASHLLCAESVSADPGRSFARAIAMYIVANIMLWEAYNKLKLSAKANATAANLQLEISRLLAAWFLLPIDLCSRLIDYFERETMATAGAHSADNTESFRDDMDLKPFLLRQAELACLLHP